MRQTISEQESTVASARAAQAMSSGTAELSEVAAEVVQVEGAVAQQPDGLPSLAVWVFHAEQAAHQADLSELPVLVADDAYFVWVDLSRYTEQELYEVARLLKLHETGVRWTLSPWQPPRLEVFGDHFFVATTLAELHVEHYHVQALQLDLFVGRNVLVSAHKQPLPFAERLLTRARHNPELVRLDSAFMLYIILGQLLEYYEDLTAHLEDQLEQIEERALTTTSDSFLEELLHFKRFVFALNRLVTQHQHVFAAFLRADFPFVSDDTIVPYFRELEAQFSQVRSTLVATKEAVNGAFNIYVSQMSHRTNQIMKLLTIVSTLLLPTTVILGFFGTNFEDLPLYHQDNFWIMATSIIIVSTVILLLFRRRGWL